MKIQHAQETGYSLMPSGHHAGKARSRPDGGGDTSKIELWAMPLRAFESFVPPRFRARPRNRSLENRGGKVG